MRQSRLLLLIPIIAGIMLAGTSKASVPLTEPAGDSTIVPTQAVISDALNEYQSLSRPERKMRQREARKLLHQYRVDRKRGTNPDGDIVFLAILAVLLPPLAVYLKEKTINKRFWIDLLLWFLFILPGIVFALLIVFGVI